MYPPSRPRPGAVLALDVFVPTGVLRRGVRLCAGVHQRGASGGSRVHASRQEPPGHVRAGGGGEDPGSLRRLFPGAVPAAEAWHGEPWALPQVLLLLLVVVVQEYDVWNWEASLRWNCHHFCSVGSVLFFVVIEIFCVLPENAYDVLLWWANLHGSVAGQKWNSCVCLMQVFIVWTLWSNLAYGKLVCLSGNISIVFSFGWGRP